MGGRRGVHLFVAHVGPRGSFSVAATALRGQSLLHFPGIWWLDRAVTHAAELLPERLRDELHHTAFALDAEDLHVPEERRGYARRQLHVRVIGCSLRHGWQVNSSDTAAARR